MKVIFLDFDGVLNSLRSCYALRGYGHPPHGDPKMYDPKLDPLAVALLRRTVEETGAKIVVSSTWRIGSKVEDFHRIFDCYAWDTREIVVGLTPSFRPNHSEPHDGRGLECNSWAVNNANVQGYVCVDDDSDFTAEQKSAGQFIQTDPRYGFDQDTYLAIVQKLGAST